ncbi:hypothetical protein HMF7854_13645 [Sphingomonas ginkgonis]|uniref:UrcA family protein n=1 Tax=Sphingomonas ginkgonis TaxID=2315330 RepID=A0A3R9YK85_9SPHN|nr:hypothetical protein [Sphingomonas ginkgonis]RST31766.1 hypothetical protein HMF7854_13645 [Sphingomonas ginkgonis]
MNRLTLSLPLLLLLAAPANAEPRTNVRDLAEQQCAVSDTDLIGKRLARACRAAIMRREPPVAQAKRAEPVRLAETNARRP